MIHFDQIKEYLEEGWSYKKIGSKFGVTRQRIQQVAKEHGYNRGESVSAQIKMRKVSISHYIQRINKERGLLNERLKLNLPEYTAENYLASLPISKRKRRDVFERDNFTCQYCGKKYPEVRLSVTHKLPATRGGTQDFSNLITACVRCASKKGYRTHEEFINNKKVTMLEALGK